MDMSLNYRWAILGVMRKKIAENQEIYNTIQKLLNANHLGLNVINYVIRARKIG